MVSQLFDTRTKRRELNLFKEDGKGEGKAQLMRIDEVSACERLAGQALDLMQCLDFRSECRVQESSPKLHSLNFQDSSTILGEISGTRH